MGGGGLHASSACFLLASTSAEVTASLLFHTTDITCMVHSNDKGLPQVEFDQVDLALSVGKGEKMCSLSRPIP